MYLSLYNTADFKKGDPLNMGIIFGVAELVGNILSEKLVKFMSPQAAIQIVLPLFAISSVVIKLPGFNSMDIYIFLFI